MKKLVIDYKSRDLNVLSFMDNFVAGEGTYRVITKCKAGFMVSSDIKVSVGGDGAEVIAIVDGKVFRTFGTLCGGYVQCLHYRYRSSLK